MAKSRLSFLRGIRATIAGIALIIVAGVVNTLPPHSTIAAVVLLVIGAMAYVFGVSALGQTRIFFSAAAASVSLMGAATLIAPTVIALNAFGSTTGCTVVARSYHYGGTNRHGRSSSSYVHTLRCANNATYSITTGSDSSHEIGDQVKVLYDPSGLMKPMFTDQHNATADAFLMGAGWLGVIATVMCAVIRKRRRTLMGPIPPNMVPDEPGVPSQN